MADLVIDAIATYRIVRFIQQDTLIEKQREKLINRYGHQAWTELLSCAWCASIWVAAGVVTARAASPRLWGMAARGLAFSAGTAVISTLVGRLENDDRE